MPCLKAKQSINHIDTSTELLLQRMSALPLADLSSDEVASSRKQLTEIALELKNLRELLSRVKYGHEDAFKEQKVTIVKVFREIEGRWTMADAILPPAEESSEPLLYTTNYIFNQHLDSLNAVAQLITLLGVICNCIAGLNHVMCDMIIATLTLIVWLTMAANLMEDSEGGCSLDPNQEIIMDQLPSSLHTAQRTIKLDGCTTMYAVCPDCNACYEPIYVTPFVSSPSYPSHCEKKNPGPSDLVVCGASLLKGRKDSALKPQKPFLMASLEDFIGQTLADPNIEMLCDKACDDAMESLKNLMDP
ncbi:hypothetical protein EV421DRAFT_1913641 [Armillaria borealis]|uniref:Uncharacterized protein n=1 Tax=Armillaria borealis TaxID=47425 RepID=A0AA39IVY3_9AGAR|nr:hypothetical protein EV421DRAFT_1913641 [Armillaria borealis]